VGQGVHAPGMAKRGVERERELEAHAIRLVSRDGERRQHN
jgi:hypothetical protein